MEVAADEELLRRAIDTLLADVTAHTPEDSVATITVEQRGGRAVAEVGDDGPGVPATQLPRIFERFYRAAALSRRPGAGRAREALGPERPSHESRMDLPAVPFARLHWHRSGAAGAQSCQGSAMFDVVYIGLTVVIFAALWLLVKGVERVER